MIGLGSWGIPGEQFAPLVFSSVDRGATWALTSKEEGHAPRTATAGGPGIVGAAWTYAGTLPFDSVSITTEDGGAWTQHESPAFSDSQVNDIAALGSRLVAVGYGFPDFQPAAWISDDGGTSWRNVALSTLAGSTGSVEAIVSQGERLIAVGASNHVESPVPTAWVSDDGGETWRPEVMGAEGTARAIAVVDGALVAVGNLGGINGDGRPLAWSSADGVLWSDADLPGDEVVVSSAVGGGDTVLVSGSCRDGCTSPLWLGTLPRASE